MRGRDPECLREADSGNCKSPEAGVCRRMGGTARRSVWLGWGERKKAGDGR